MSELPSGTVTFLFTDLEVSTRLWEQEPDAMRTALARHDALLRDAVAAHGGHVVKGTGDGVHAAFATADAAVRVAIDAQRAVGAEGWGVSEPLRVRMGLHAGVAELRDGDYFGSAVNRAARLMAVAHGGQVVCSQTIADLARDAVADSVAFVDLGEHRLRDLSRPEHVFQVNAPDLAKSFPPLRSLDALPGNLPLQTSSFIGRERELARVVDAFDAARVVTLTGVGGVGKTRLALQVAADLSPRFREGAWLIELAPVRDPEEVVSTFAAVFGMSARAGVTLAETLVEHFRTKQLLLVVDNCEHVLGAVAELVNQIERSCAGIVVLATSREGLSVEGEQMFSVPSLAVSTADDSAEAVLRSDAVRLFVERAMAVAADFTVTVDNVAAVGEVCRRLDGIPLAIELAAARVGAMSPAQLARRLDQRFRVLAGGRRGALERHQTLRATIDWSYELLSHAQQRLLARLAVFAGGTTMAAVEAVCAGAPVEAEDIFELLSDLVARSLVVAEPDGVEHRYRLLETIRQYGEERLDELGETAVLRVRHCDHYTEFTGIVRSQCYGPGQIEWGARLAREHDNLLAAMAFAIDTEDLERAMRLLGRLPFPDVQVNDVVVFDPTSILALPGARDHPGSAVALLFAGWNAFLRDDGPLALELCDEAVAAEQRLGALHGSMLADGISGVRGMAVSYARGAREAAEIWLDAAQRARADGSLARTGLWLGSATYVLAMVDPATAMLHGTEGLALARRSGMPSAITMNLLGLALSYAPDDPGRARALLDEAIQQSATLGYESETELSNAVFVAARLAAWPTVLRIASRLLWHQRRSGGLDVVYLTLVRVLVTRGLADQRPESGAVLDGAASALMRRLTTQMVAASAGASPREPDAGAVLVGDVIGQTAQILTAALSAARLSALRDRGEAMDDDEVIAFALEEIDHALAGQDLVTP